MIARSLRKGGFTNSYKISPEKGGWVRAIALSAYAGEYDQRQALKAGFQKHISKPVEPDALLREILELQQQPESALNGGRC